MTTLPAPDPADEGLHQRGDEPLWNESWYFDWFQPDGELGGYVRIGLYPNLGVTWYWACVVEPGGQLVTVVDHHVPLPTSGLELRAGGLWADHNAEEPLERWSLGLESFALGLDDPTAIYVATPRGDQVAFGFDLEWETDGAPYRYPVPLERYEIPCRVHGEVLVGDRRIEVDGWGQRDHSWGVRDWWLLGHVWFAVRLEDGTRAHASVPMLEGLDWAAGYVQRPDGTATEIRDGVRIEESAGPEGLHGPVHIAIADLDLELTPTAWSPVAMDAPDGRRALLPRALLAVTAADGRRGAGWMERNFLV